MSIIHLASLQFTEGLVDGPGIRTLVFFQGCDIHCPGCHNRSTWDMGRGVAVDVGRASSLIRAASPNRRVTFIGGEPLMQREGLIELCRLLPDFDICLYTGHKADEVPSELVGMLTYLKTGPFVKDLRTTTTPFVGSANQIFRRII